MITKTSTANLKKQYASVFQIDADLDRLVRRIELLSYINPINAQKEKQRFIASKFSIEPVFRYPKLKFNPYKLHRLFFAQRLERIEDAAIHQLYQDIIFYYSNMVQCIQSIGQGRNFYFNSLRVFGTPTEKQVENARFILHFASEPDAPDMEKVYTTEEAAAYFEGFSKRFDFPLHIEFSNHIAAQAMVSNAKRALILRKNTKFSQNDLDTLANHEIGVHLLTTFNALEQPLKIFSNGFPKNVETQEGLAVFSEYVCGALTLKRLKELAYRVIACDSLSKGYDFRDTFALIHGQYKLDQEAAFAITLRAHRGGGFTKDHLYLSGLKKIYRRYQAEKSMDTLTMGKVSIDDEKAIDHLQYLGLATSPKYQNFAFEDNKNKDKKLDFILNNLK